MSKLANQKTKSLSQLIKEAGRTCSNPDCDKPLTHYEGLGSDSLCREHQLIQLELQLKSRHFE
jgi:hypothetical protein